MACQYCDTHWFWKKIGRCRRCMLQLSALCFIFWPCLWLLPSHFTQPVQLIALLAFGIVCHALLALHLIMVVAIKLGREKQKALESKSDSRAS